MELTKLFRLGLLVSILYCSAISEPADQDDLLTARFNVSEVMIPMRDSVRLHTKIDQACAQESGRRLSCAVESARSACRDAKGADVGIQGAGTVAGLLCSREEEGGRCCANGVHRKIPG